MNREEQIAERRKQIPNRYKRIYKKAMRGRSLKTAVQAFCLECVCWQRLEVEKCTDEACPLFPYRPYQEIPWRRQRGVTGHKEGRFRKKTNETNRINTRQVCYSR